MNVSDPSKPAVTDEMLLKAVIISVKYGDILAHTLPHTRHQVDELIVVTTPDDKHTRRLCEQYNVRRLETNVFYQNDLRFNKGAAINEGLRAMNVQWAGTREWFIHMDADILPPPRMKEILRNLRHELDKEGIYGADRLMCQSYEDFTRYMADPEIHVESNMWNRGGAFPLNVRVCPVYQGGGYVPIGFFQLWNPHGSNVRKYPEGGAAHKTDYSFGVQFARRHRHLLPELFMLHLEPDFPQRMGMNWGGRQTRTFGPGNAGPVERYHAGDMKLYE
jgi:hypothetical protein